jgi:tRNA(adenine34) deaminase
MDHEHFMRDAIREGELSVQDGGRAFACVLVKNDAVVARGRNRVLQAKDPTSHAELNLVRAYCAENGITDLGEYTLYTDCEPCAMCSSAIAWTKVGRVVFGADRADGPTGYARQLGLSCAEVIERSGSSVEVVAHVLREECAALFV